MDWQGLFNGLGNAGDILAGKESYNSIKRGNQANSLAKDQLAWQANNAQANRAQEGMLQQNSFGQQNAQQQKQQEFLQQLETLRQINEMAKMQKQQEFLATQNNLDRGQALTLQDNQFGQQSDILNRTQTFEEMMANINQLHRLQSQIRDQDFRSGESAAERQWRTGENALDRTSAMDRTMKPLEFQYDRNPMNQPISMGESTMFGNSALAGLTPGRLQALGQGAIGQATMQDPMMTKAFGNTFTQMQNNATIKQIIDSLGIGQGLNPGSVSPFQSQRSPSISAPAAPQQRKGNY